MSEQVFPYRKDMLFPLAFFFFPAYPDSSRTQKREFNV